MLHTTTLSPKAQDLVKTTLARATRRFNLTNALTAVEPSSCGIPSIVLHGSILQNEVLFSSEGLTLLSMDHLYTFKSALAHYTTGRTEPGSEFRLEDAVDDLRRYVLSAAGGRRRLLKSVLVQAYDWLGQVNDFALSDVTEMYCRAYGGATGDCGVEDDLVKPSPIIGSIEPALKPIESIPSTGSDVQDTTVESPAIITDAPTALGVPPVPQGKADALIIDLDIVQKETHDPIETSLSPSKDVAEQDSKTPTQQPPQLILQTQSQPQFLKTPSPRASPKASLPALRVQTSFTQPIKPKPRRQETPVPLQKPQPIRKKKSSQKQQLLLSLDADVVPLSAVCNKPMNLDMDKKKETEQKEEDIAIQIEIHADEDEGNSTEFEDADLTARPPPSATCGRTPVEPMWSGIDEILGNSSSRRTSKRGGIMMPHHPQHQRRRSSSLVLQSPQQDTVGPTTPNGYDDISPITRGEWGFLMVSDPFRTKTAAVSCV